MTAQLIERCRKASEFGAPTLKGFSTLMKDILVDEPDLQALIQVDESKPYGRNVILNDDLMEGMVATWTHKFECAPHDHGGSVGAVKILQGRAVHKIYRVVNDELTVVESSDEGPGAVLLCGPEMIHSMCSVDPTTPLVTLHLYAGPITHMNVFDTPNSRTIVVTGGCGAWIPKDEPELIMEILPGMTRAQVQ